MIEPATTGGSYETGRKELLLADRAGAGNAAAASSVPLADSPPLGRSRTLALAALLVLALALPCLRAAAKPAAVLICRRTAQEPLGCRCMDSAWREGARVSGAAGGRRGACACCFFTSLAMLRSFSSMALHTAGVGTGGDGENDSP